MLTTIHVSTRPKGFKLWIKSCCPFEQNQSNESNTEQNPTQTEQLQK